MAVSLSSLVARLQSLAPPRDGLPTESGYMQCVKDAALQLSQDAPRRLWGELAVISGTAQYLLPADFLFLIDWPVLTGAGGVMIDARGIIPMPDGGWRERVMTADDVLTIYPTPTYSLPRSYRYAAAHVLTGEPGSEVYSTLNENAARVTLLYATYLVLSQQAQAAAAGAWKYQIGDEMVDKSRLADVGMGAAQVALQGYKLALHAVKSL
jgi:hypothetical protein